MQITPPSLRQKVPTISSSVEQVVLKALAKEPQQRFSNVMDFANALEQASQLERAAIPIPPPKSQPSPLSPS